MPVRPRWFPALALGWACTGSLACSLACSADDEDAGGSAAGGAPTGGSGGTVSGSGGVIVSGGSTASGGSTGTGGAVASGGDASAGGTEAGGASGAGGAAVGGASGTGGAEAQGLSWPIDCIPGSTCLDLGYPDADDDGVAFDCGEPGYLGHDGTDIPITWEQMDAGVAVFAAADGTVFFASDGKYDRCPDEDEPDCDNPPDFVAGSTQGTTVCTELGPYCHPPGGSCFWCFAGGNVVVLLHETTQGVFATRYDHLKNGSVLVDVGDTVRRGEPLAEVGSAGSSTGPHLHFEVWGAGYYDVVEPWHGTCGPNVTASLWVSDPPWAP